MMTERSENSIICKFISVAPYSTERICNELGRKFLVEFYFANKQCCVRHDFSPHTQNTVIAFNDMRNVVVSVPSKFNRNKIVC